MRLINDISDFIFLENDYEKVDVIFIPGGSYPEIAEKAAEIWCKGYSPLILPSGKYSVKRGYFPGVQSKASIYDKNYQTEWEFLKDVLIQNGVNQNGILREDEATNTYENAIFSKKVTDYNKLNIRKAIICCKSFHARRCFMYFQMLYPQTQFIICPSEIRGINKENWFKSDDGIKTVMGELARCGNQFAELIKQISGEIGVNYGRGS
jgi:uncharacterized SAM-binding protein YcdF (DUF218 family)